MRLISLIVDALIFGFLIYIGVDILIAFAVIVLIWIVESIIFWIARNPRIS